jgi:cytochrome c biogenesis protein CcmG/thiol:disulfide interchange protein DsbE
VRVLGVDFDDTASLARGFLSSYGASWPAISDTAGQIGLRWGVDEPPESFLIAPSGKVLTKMIGPISAKQIEGLITVATFKGY